MKKILICLFLSMAATINCSDVTQLELQLKLVTAVKNNDVQAVQEAIDQGADVNYVATSSCLYNLSIGPVLVNAVLIGNITIINTLLAAGASITQVETNKGIYSGLNNVIYTALSAAIIRKRRNNDEVLLRLLETNQPYDYNAMMCVADKYNPAIIPIIEEDYRKKQQLAFAHKVATVTKGFSKYLGY